MNSLGEMFAMLTSKIFYLQCVQAQCYYGCLTVCSGKRHWLGVQISVLSPPDDLKIFGVREKRDVSDPEMNETVNRFCC